MIVWFLDLSLFMWCIIQTNRYTNENGDIAKFIHEIWKDLGH